MNPTNSALQSKFPLSPKKIWKKLFSSVAGAFAVAIAAGAVYPISQILKESPPPNSRILFITIVLFVAIFIFVECIYAIYFKHYIKTYFYEGEPNYLTIRKGVFTSTEIHVPYNKIQDVYVDQDFADRFIFGLYDVHIASATAGSAIEAHIDGVEKADAEGLKNYLLNRLHGGSEVNTGASLNSSVPEKISGSDRITLNLDRKISHIEYPIISAWWAVSIIKSIGMAALSILVVLYIFAETEIGGEIILLAVIVAPVLTFIWQIITLSLFKKNYMFDFTPEYLYMRNGIFSMSESHMPYNTIQDVKIQQSFLDRIFGIYNVVIANASNGVIIPGKNVISDNSTKIIGLSKNSSDEISSILKSKVLGMHDTSMI